VREAPWLLLNPACCCELIAGEPAATAGGELFGAEVPTASAAAAIAAWGCPLLVTAKPAVGTDVGDVISAGRGMLAAGGLPVCFSAAAAAAAVAAEDPAGGRYAPSSMAGS
jgi:hypothetical protein